MSSFDSIVIDGDRYELKQFSGSSAEIFRLIEMTQGKIADSRNLLSLLTRAKNAYIEDLKTEIVQEKSGVDLDLLFADD